MKIIQSDIAASGGEPEAAVFMSVLDKINNTLVNILKDLCYFSEGKLSNRFWVILAEASLNGCRYSGRVS